jgi:hypothetical protein
MAGDVGERYYESIRGHVAQHPKLREALIAQCVADDANTIWSAIQQMTPGQFERGLARMLSRHYDNHNFEPIPDSERARIAQRDP